MPEKKKLKKYEELVEMKREWLSEFRGSYNRKKYFYQFRIEINECKGHALLLFFFYCGVGIVKMKSRKTICKWRVMRKY